MLTNLHHDPINIPLGGMVTDLILDKHRVPNSKLRQNPAVPVQLLHITNGPLGQGLLPVLPQHNPLGLGLVPGLGGREKVSQVSAENNLGWAQLSVPIWSVAIGHQSLQELVIGQAAIPVCVLAYEPLHALDTELRPLVALGKGDRGQPVPDTIVREKLLRVIGCVGQAPVTRKFLRDAIGGKILPQPGL